ncbi:MAG: CRTAC1 family protein [Phycisphaerae bacterium]|nr:CRTAC1 family protein [Phycisphaerae bacterium]
MARGSWVRTKLGARTRSGSRRWSRRPFGAGPSGRAFAAFAASGTIAGATLATPPTFVDVTASAHLAATHDPSAALLFAASIIADLIAPVVVGDFDRNGLQDVFVVCSGKQPDKLFMNLGGGVFIDRAAEWGVAVKHMGLSACAGDYDRDGDLDLYVMSAGLDGAPLAKGKHRLYRNEGGTRFAEVAASAGVQVASPVLADGLGCAFGDYDLDGDLDLAVGGYFIPSQGNRLFRNNGNGTFTDVTVAAGLFPMPIYNFSPRFADMDGDRHPELLMAADFHTSRYYRNNANGTFTNLTPSNGTGTDDNGMGHAVADFDGDGRLDWFVTSIWAVGSFESPGTGNRLYRNLGGHAYADIASASGTLNGNWAWGVSAVDLDHSGSVDLVQTNGWFTQPQFVNQPARVWMNDGAANFTDVAATCGLWHTLSGRGLATLDADNDGDRDVLIMASKGPLRFYRNDLVVAGAPVPADANWLRVSVDATGAPRVAPDGIGTLVLASAGGTLQRRLIDGGTNYQSQDELAAHFGLGTATTVDELRLRWTDGTVTMMRRVPANQRLEIEIGRRCDLDGDDHVGGRDLGELLGAWGEIDPTDLRDLNASGEVDLDDLELLLSAWGI